MRYTFDMQTDNTTAASNFQASYQPLYEQIKKMLTQSLIDGEWRAGELIPSEMELASRFGVSPGTVRKAIDDLVSENILVRKQGKGTYVATHAEEGVKLRFLRLADKDGKKAFPHNRLLSCTRAKVNAHVGRKLDIKTGTAIIEIKRLLLFSERPLILDHIILPAAPFRGLGDKQIQNHKGSMYSMYEREYGIRMIRAEEELKAIGADLEASKILGVPLCSPLLQIERTAYTYGNRPMEWRLGICLTDEYHYRNELE
jgi:GntR family transcriptional regulator